MLGSYCRDAQRYRRLAGSDRPSPAGTTMRRCATRSRTSPPRSERSSPPTSPTSTGPSSPWSTCRRPSRGRFLPAIRGIPGPCGASTWRSSRPTRRPAGGPSTARRASAGRAALRAGLPRLRRRLDRPGRRRPRRLRVGLQHPHQAAAARPPRRLPRAVDPLHPLRQAAARRGRLPLLPRRGARPRVRARRWTSCSRSTRAR